VGITSKKSSPEHEISSLLGTAWPAKGSESLLLSAAVAEEKPQPTNNTGNRDAPDTDLAGYPTYLKVGYRRFDEAGYRTSGRIMMLNV
jgi:hypothetical protein